MFRKRLTGFVGGGTTKVARSGGGTGKWADNAQGETAQTRGKTFVKQWIACSAKRKYFITYQYQWTKNGVQVSAAEEKVQQTEKELEVTTTFSAKMFSCPRISNY